MISCWMKWVLTYVLNLILTPTPSAFYLLCEKPLCLFSCQLKNHVFFEVFPNFSRQNNPSLPDLLIAFCTWILQHLSHGIAILGPCLWLIHGHSIECIISSYLSLFFSFKSVETCNKKALSKCLLVLYFRYQSHLFSQPVFI